jgi:putative ABC transport system substrate-binding protein
MRRRELILLLSGSIAARRAFAVEQKAVPVIGFLHSGWAEPAASVVAALRQGLTETGYVEGQNVAIEYC